MFETCVNRRSELSAFRGFGFHLERRIIRPARRRHMHLKRLNMHPNLHARAAMLAPHRSSASIDTVFRNEQCDAEPQNVGNCHQFAATCPVLAARLRWFARHPAMRLKRFN
jgi:tRNA(Leu) C34 or U34 (ribose-2'-O)-methylase TrmL